MKETLPVRPVILKLHAQSAADLMVPNPISIRADANVREALVLLTDKGFSAAPVIDEAGRPVGVLSRSDLLVHDREQPNYVRSEAVGEHRRGNYHHIPEGFQEENVDLTTVGDLMTPAIFSVTPDTPASKVVSEMIGLHVHRLFVVDEDGTLVGVITSMDVLKHLRP